MTTRTVTSTVSLLQLLQKAVMSDHKYDQLRVILLSIFSIRNADVTCYHDT